MTPGTALADETGDGDSGYNNGGHRNSFLMSISTGVTNYDTNSNTVGLAWADVNTGEFVTAECALDSDVIAALIARVAPVEVIMLSSNEGDVAGADTPLSIVWRAVEERRLMDRFIVSTRTTEDFDGTKCSTVYRNFMERVIDPMRVLKKRRSGGSVKRQQDQAVAVTSNQASTSTETAVAAGALLSYVNENFLGLSPYFHMDSDSADSQQNAIVSIDAATISCLEIVKTIRDGDKKGSLLHALDRTKTACGSRLMAARLS